MTFENILILFIVVSISFLVSMITISRVRKERQKRSAQEFKAKHQKNVQQMNEKHPDSHTEQSKHPHIRLVYSKKK